MSKDVLSVDFSKNVALSELEGKVLTQYQQLAIKLKVLAEEIRRLNVASENDVDGLATQLAQNLRGLESKLGLVYTLFRGAVYTLILQAQGEQKQEYEYEDTPDKTFTE